MNKLEPWLTFDRMWKCLMIAFLMALIVFIEGLSQQIKQYHSDTDRKLRIQSEITEKLSHQFLSGDGEYQE